MGLTALRTQLAAIANTTEQCNIARKLEVVAGKTMDAQTLLQYFAFAAMGAVTNKSDSVQLDRLPSRYSFVREAIGVIVVGNDET